MSRKARDIRAAVIFLLTLAGAAIVYSQSDSTLTINRRKSDVDNSTLKVDAVTGKMYAVAGTGSGYVLTSRSVSTTAPLAGGGDLSADRTLSIPVATSSANGYLSSTDWSTFNNKVGTSRSISTTSPLSGGGDLSANRTLSIAAATSSVNGYLSSTDWATFNNKVSASRSISTTAPISGGGDLSADRTLSMHVADATHDGYLSSADWSTFSTGGGAVSSVFSRTGAVVATTGDYTAAQVTGAVANTRTISTTAPITGGGDLSADRTIACSASSTSASGCVQLSSSTSSSSTSLAATASAVKTAYDLASSAETDAAAAQVTANAALPLSGGTMTGRELFYETTGITAGTTQTQAGATALACQVCRVATVGTDGDGVRLPTAAVGERILVLNQGAHSLAVYPATSGAIAGGSTNASITIEAGGAREFSGASSTAWDYAVPIGSSSVVGLLKIGTASGTACDGADSRLSDSRAPTGSAGGDLSGTYPNPSVIAGSTSTAGKLQLTDSTSSTSTTTAATPNSVKTAYDRTSASGVYSAFTSKSTPVGADILAIEDSAASNAKKKTTFTNLLATFLVSASAAGFAPAATGSGTKFLNDTGSYSTPSGSGGSSIWSSDVPPSSPSSQDDEFPNGSLAVKWATWDPGTVFSTSIVNNHLQMTSNAGAVKWAGIYQAVPSSEFAVYAKVGVDCLISEIVDVALFVSEDLVANPTTADFISAEVFSSTSNAHGWITRRWSAYNGTASGASTTMSDKDIHGIYARMRVNGSSVSSDFSNDGSTWFTLQTVTFSGTPVDYGLTILSQTASVTRHVSVEFFRSFSGAGTSGKDATSIGGLL